jgi:3-deoxy-D-manno-octulosonate 8-phosphate phosphatase (KDO 8-P phosphatase)
VNTGQTDLLIILDVDGVMTDGTKHYDRDGNVIAKTFCDKDWTSIKRLRALGIPVVFLTGDSFNQQILKNRNLPVYVNRGQGYHNDKALVLPEILTTYGISADNTVYLGDDLFDIGIMRAVKHAFCLKDSPAIVKKEAQVLEIIAGENCIQHLLEVLEAQGLIPAKTYDQIMPEIYRLDLEEKF